MWNLQSACRLHKTTLICTYIRSFEAVLPLYLQEYIHTATACTHTMVCVENFMIGKYSRNIFLSKCAPNHTTTITSQFTQT